MNKIKRIINWLNWNIGGLRDPDCFFSTGDPVADHIAAFGFDKPTLN